VIFVPKATGNCQVSRRTVELVDLHPTLADLCGLPAPSGLEGKSLRPLIDDPARAWDRPAYTQVSRGVPVATDEPVPKGVKTVMGRSVRTERWRYTEWDDGKQGVELYDHDADPHEWTNLAKEATYASTVTEMKRLLAAVRK